MAHKFKWLFGLYVLGVAFLFSGCSQSAILARHKYSGSSAGKISAISDKSKPPKKVCDLRVQIKITDPIAPYMSDFGTVDVYGNEGFHTSKQFPVKFGTQLVTIPELEAGRYSVQVSYGTIVATKCVIMGCTCIDNWKEVFSQAAADELRKEASSCKGCSKYTSATGWASGNYGWSGGGTSGRYWSAKGSNSSFGGWGSAQKTPELKNSGQLKMPCSTVTPCGRNVSFEFPKDAKE